MRHHLRRDDVIALAAVILIALASYLGSRFAWFRLFFSWPEGGTWSNTIAWLEDDAIALFVVWYFRDNVGKHIVAWWHRLRQEHMESHMASVRAHVTQELVSFEARMQAELQSHHDRILSALNGNTGESDGSPSTVNHNGTSADGSACD